MAYDYETNGQAAFHEAEFDYERRCEDRVERALEIAEEYVKTQKGLLQLQKDRFEFEKENDKRLSNVEAKIDKCLASLISIERIVGGSRPVPTTSNDSNLEIKY